jgi:hypothetical protein
MSLNDIPYIIKVGFDGIDRTAKVTVTKYDITLEFEGKEVDDHILIFGKEDFEYILQKARA